MLSIAMNMNPCSQRLWTRHSLALPAAVLFALLLSPFESIAKETKPIFKEGVSRVDWNRKVRDLCVDFYTNDDLTARDWQGVLAAHGIICKLHDVKQSKTKASWTGRCEFPSIGKIAKVEHRVRIETFTDGRFEIETVISGDQQATIPIRGEPLREANGAIKACEKDHAPFRPWQ
jgi:hypothetical protein